MNVQSILLIAGGGLAAIALLTLTLPSSVHIEREAIIEAPPNKIFALASTNSGFQKFNPYKDADPDLKIDLFGPDHGVGSGFSFNGKDGKGTQTITALEPNNSVTMQIDLGAKGRPTQSFRLEEVSTGTRVIWGLDADFGYNPVGRIIGLFMEKMMGETFERGLRNLSKAVSS